MLYKGLVRSQSWMGLFEWLFNSIHLSDLHLAIVSAAVCPRVQTCYCVWMTSEPLIEIINLKVLLLTITKPQRLSWKNDETVCVKSLRLAVGETVKFSSVLIWTRHEYNWAEAFLFWLYGHFHVLHVVRVSMEFCVMSQEMREKRDVEWEKLLLLTPSIQREGCSRQSAVTGAWTSTCFSSTWPQLLRDTSLQVFTCFGCSRCRNITTDVCWGCCCGAWPRVCRGFKMILYTQNTKYLLILLIWWGHMATSRFFWMLVIWSD